MPNTYVITHQGNFYSTDELYHHGILGMKWGIRRYQNRDGSLTNAGEKRYNSGIDEHKSESVDSSDRKKGLSDKQKRAIKIGAAVAVTALAAYGGYKLYKSGKLDKLINKGKTRVSNASDAVTKMNNSADKGKSASDILASKLDSSLLDNKTGLKLQSEKGSITDNLKKINPGYNLYDRSSYMNCGNCSIAFEARMRGYDVTALGNTQGMRLSQLGEFFKGFDSNSFHTVDSFDIPKTGPGKAKAVSDAIKSTISKNYDGDARGTVFYTHEMGSHYFSWIKQGNDIKFYDAQNPNMDFDRLFAAYKRNTGANCVYETKICRLDNLEINPDNIKSIIKNVGDSSVDFHDSDFDALTSKGKSFIMKYSHLK